MRREKGGGRQQKRENGEIWERGREIVPRRGYLSQDDSETPDSRTQEG